MMFVRVGYVHRCPSIECPDPPLTPHAGNVTAVGQHCAVVLPSHCMGIIALELTPGNGVRHRPHPPGGVYGVLCRLSSSSPLVVCRRRRRHRRRIRRHHRCHSHIRRHHGRCRRRRIIIASRAIVVVVVVAGSHRTHLMLSFWLDAAPTIDLAHHPRPSWRREDTSHSHPHNADPFTHHRGDRGGGRWATVLPDAPPISWAMWAPLVVSPVPTWQMVRVCTCVCTHVCI